MNLNNIYIVLDHPDECRNIGSACRAMANNDITHLRIVGKKEDYDTEKVHILAIHASYIYDNAEFFDCVCGSTVFPSGAYVKVGIPDSVLKNILAGINKNFIGKAHRFNLPVFLYNLRDIIDIFGW